MGAMKFIKLVTNAVVPTIIQKENMKNHFLS